MEVASLGLDKLVFVTHIANITTPGLISLPVKKRVPVTKRKHLPCKKLLIGREKRGR